MRGGITTVKGGKIGLYDDPRGFPVCGYRFSCTDKLTTARTVRDRLQRRSVADFRSLPPIRIPQLDRLRDASHVIGVVIPTGSAFRQELRAKPAGGESSQTRKPKTLPKRTFMWKQR